MHNNQNRRGVVLVMVVFIVALLGAIVMGMLQIETEEIQIMRNHIHAAEALAVAEAGLNDALAELRADATWNDGFADKPFSGGAYSVTVDATQVMSVGISAQGYHARVTAEVSVAPQGPPHNVRISSFRVNE